eukprot:scaffold13416_cov20-Tisochrysis_lutea.AAC.1
MAACSCSWLLPLTVMRKLVVYPLASSGQPSLLSCLQAKETNRATPAKRQTRLGGSGWRAACCAPSRVPRCARCAVASLCCCWAVLPEDALPRFWCCCVLLGRSCSPLGSPPLQVFCEWACCNGRGAESGKQVERRTKGGSKQQVSREEKQALGEQRVEARVGGIDDSSKEREQRVGASDWGPRSGASNREAESGR